jgi:hypothetical protein
MHPRASSSQHSILQLWLLSLVALVLAACNSATPAVTTVVQPVTEAAA